MMRRTGSNRGVTLIELLIAVTLVSLLSAGMLFAMRVGYDALEKTNSRFLASRRVLGAQRALQRQIAGLMPVTVRCGGAPIMFFHGAPSAMRFVSRYSLEEAARGRARILDYSVIPGDRGMGVRLVVNELLYTGPSSVEPFCAGPGAFRFSSPNPRSFVLADRLAYCRISYLISDPQTRERRWVASYSGATTPAAIRLDMAPLEPDPSRLQMVTLTAPVRVTRNAREKYADVDEPLPR